MICYVFLLLFVKNKIQILHHRLLWSVPCKLHLLVSSQLTTTAFSSMTAASHFRASAPTDPLVWFTLLADCHTSGFLSFRFQIKYHHLRELSLNPSIPLYHFFLLKLLHSICDLWNYLFTYLFTVSLHNHQTSLVQRTRGEQSIHCPISSS